MPMSVRLLGLLLHDLRVADVLHDATHDDNRWTTNVRSMSIQLRVSTDEDWAVFRSLRLRALADSPDAFAVTWAEADQEPEAFWRERASGPQPVVLAFDGDQAIAMGGVHAPEDTADAFIWDIWVEPESRGKGLGTRIVRELVAYADELRRDAVLHVSEHNDARGLYEASGFTSTGEWEPLRPVSDVRMELMRRVRASAQG
jgi:ribosomal protein S18 acetylase RimI-like enzyme